jgi:hypothetical protein
MTHKMVSRSGGRILELPQKQLKRQWQVKLKRDEAHWSNRSDGGTGAALRLVGLGAACMGLPLGK